MVLWSGSLGPRSANAAALDVAAAHLATVGVDTRWVDHLREIPAFRPDQVEDPPPSVVALRAALEAADGVLLAAPEYAGGVAGSTKNALDWLVGSGSVHHRLVGVLSAGTTGGEFALEQLVRTLSWQGALVVATLGIEAPRTKVDGDGVIADPATISDIERWADAVVDAHGTSPATKLRLVAPIVEPLGIDPARFGIPS